MKKNNIMKLNISIIIITILSIIIISLVLLIKQLHNLFVEYTEVTDSTIQLQNVYLKEQQEEIENLKASENG